MKKIYLAAPLFNEMELQRNRDLSNVLKKWGYDVFLPQEASGLSARIIPKDGAEKISISRRIFESDLNGIKDCDILLFCLDGRVPDEGACVELGIAFTLEKKCIGFKTDDRSLDFTGMDNLFIEGCMNFRIMHTIDELHNELKKIEGTNESRDL